MKFIDFLTKTKDFLIRRVTELLGLMIVIASFAIMISLVSYSPNDPNFISNEFNKVENLLGLKGSIFSDFLFQSIGIVAYFFPITLFFSGINVFLKKRQIILIDNLFFSVIYIIFGCLFFSYFSNESFFLTINGSGGFVGLFLKNSFFGDLIIIEENIAYYFLIIISISIFLISINFRISYTYNIFIELIKLFKNKKSKVNENEFTVQNNISQNMEDTKTIQEILPFESKTNISVKKFILPDIKFLKLPTRNEKVAKTNDDINDEFLEKVLLDFGVEGKIKKINYGPVVTLNEFEPAAGVKVSKIINLAEDIARNTSSESARISIIPGSNTIGIELPNITRENVYLGEVIKDSQFKKKDLKLPIALGKSISGNPIIGDLSVMPHLLIAGTTGSGKSV